MSIRKTLDELEVPRSTFYNWYRRYQEDGHDGLADKKPGPRQFWNQIPESVREQVVELALAYPEKSSRQLAWQFTDEEEYFVSESSVYRILKGYDLVQSPAFLMVPAKDRFENPTSKVNELWQTVNSGLKCPLNRGLKSPLFIGKNVRWASFLNSLTCYLIE